MDGIDNKYIENAIITLSSTIGIKDHVDDQKLVSLIHSKKVKECIKEIAKCLGLPIEINLSYVPRGYRADSTNKFYSTAIVETNWRGRGNEGITAQVFIPSDLPSYGNSHLNNYPIKVKISENCTDNPATFIAVMAHELSHIILHSLGHKEKDNEIYTDITAMMLGFSDVLKNGRKVIKTTEHFNTRETQTTTYGYLSDVQFSFAYNKIETALNRYKGYKNKLDKQIKKLQKKLTKNRKIIIFFQRYLEYVDKNLNQKMSKEDGYRISTFHQAGYTDEFEQMVRKTESELKKFNTFTQNLNYYNESLLNTITQYEEKIRVFTSDLNSKYNKLRTDVDILKRYVSFGYKMNVFFKVYFGN